MSDTPDNIIPLRPPPASKPATKSDEAVDAALHAMLETWIADWTHGEGCLLADGFDGAFVGLADGGGCYRAVYDAFRCIDILQKRDGMDYDEAEEFFQFNVLGANVGEGTPIYIHTWSRREVLP